METPIAEQVAGIDRECVDSPLCNARKYRVDLKIAVRSENFDLLSNAGRCRPCLADQLSI
jgi:hypothetical protein